MPNVSCSPLFRHYMIFSYFTNGDTLYTRFIRWTSWDRLQEVYQTGKKPVKPDTRNLWSAKKKIWKVDWFEKLGKKIREIGMLDTVNCTDTASSCSHLLIARINNWQRWRLTIVGCFAVACLPAVWALHGAWICEITCNARGQGGPSKVPAVLHGIAQVVWHSFWIK